MAPEIQRTEPPYAQIAAYLRGQIIRGELKPGDLLPSSTKIMDEWKVSRATANRALAALQSEGLAEGHVGIGTAVLKRPTENEG